MSIKLCVEDYCHSCPNFEADVDKAITRDFENNPVIVATVIHCEHRDICKNMSKYLKSYKGGDRE